MLTFWLNRLQIFHITLRAGVVLGLWQRVTGLGMLPDFRIGVGIILAVFKPCGHVQHLAQGGVAKRRLGQLGHVVDDFFIGIEGAISHQHCAHRAHHRFGHGHGAVLAFGGQHTKVTLINNFAAVQHDYAVGVIRSQRLLPGHRLLAAQRQEGQCVDIRAQGFGQRYRRAQATGDIGGGHQLTEVGNTPAHGRKLEITAVGKPHDAIRRWRRADHPAHLRRVAGSSIRVRGFFRGTGDGSGQARQ